MEHKWFIQLMTDEQIEINEHNREKIMRNTNPNENLRIERGIQVLFVPIRNIKFMYELVLSEK